MAVMVWNLVWSWLQSLQPVLTWCIQMGYQHPHLSTSAGRDWLLMILSRVQWHNFLIISEQYHATKGWAVLEIRRKDCRSSSKKTKNPELLVCGERTEYLGYKSWWVWCGQVMFFIIAKYYLPNYVALVSYPIFKVIDFVLLKKSYCSSMTDGGTKC